MNINDLNPTSYTPLSTPSSAPLNINNLPKGAATPVSNSELNSTTATDYLKGVFNQYAQIPQNLVNDIQTGASDIQKGLSGTGTATNPTNKTIQSSAGSNIAKGIVKTGLRTAGDTAQAIFAPITQALSMAVGSFRKDNPQVAAAYDDVINKIGDVISNSKTVQSLATAHPNASQDFQRGLALLPGGDESAVNDAGGQVATGVANTVKTISDTASRGLDAVAESTKTPVPTQADTDDHIASVASDWAKPTTLNNSIYNKAKAVLAKDPEVTTTLAKLGQNPYDHIQDDKYDTADTAQAIRDDNGKASGDFLRPALTFADQYTPATPVSSLRSAALDYIKNGTSIVPDNEEALNAKIETKLSALERKYPNGMTLEDKLNKGIVYDKNGGYDPTKSDADNDNAIANRALGHASRAVLSQSAPAALGIDAFQEILSHRYRAADYLDTLNGRKAPLTLGQAITKKVAPFVGAKIAEMFGGGSMVSAFGGYQIGKGLENLFENMTNPLRDTYLQNLRQTNPPAFEKVKSFIGETQANADASIKLPAGPEKPIIIPNINSSIDPADTPPTSQQAKRGFPFQDPVTGKMTASFTQESSPVQYIKDLKTKKVRIIQK